MTLIPLSHCSGKLANNHLSYGMAHTCIWKVHTFAWYLYKYLYTSLFLMHSATLLQEIIQYGFHFINSTPNIALIIDCFSLMYCEDFPFTNRVERWYIHIWVTLYVIMKNLLQTPVPFCKPWQNKESCCPLMLAHLYAYVIV